MPASQTVNDMAVALVAVGVPVFVVREEVAQDLHNIQIRNQHKILTLDIEDLYVNLPIQNIVSITKFWLHKHNNQHTIITQT